MPTTNHCAPDEYRAQLRRQVRDAARSALETCAANARGVWAATIGVSHQLLDRAIARDGDKALHVSDVLAGPEPVRLALAQLLVGEGRVVVELPTADEAADDWRLAAKAQRESGEAIAATLDAIADGRVSAKEGAVLARGCDEAIAALLGIRERARLAMRERVVAIRPAVSR